MSDNTKWSDQDVTDALIAIGFGLLMWGREWTDAPRAVEANHLLVGIGAGLFAYGLVRIYRRR